MIAVRLACLLGLACLAACGSGSEPEPARGAEALQVTLLPNGRLRWTTPERAEGKEEAIPTPGARLSREGETVLQDVATRMPSSAVWRLRLPPAATWGPVAQTLRSVHLHGGVVIEGTGHEHLVLREPPRAKHDLQALVTLERQAEEGRRVLRLALAGIPWVQRHGCGGSGGELHASWPGWDGAALDDLATALDGAIETVEGDASRLAIRLRAGADVPAQEVLGAWSHLAEAGAWHVGLVLDGDGSAHRIHGAVERALAWLAAHQSPDGRWESAGFDRWCEGEVFGCAELGVGEPGYDVHATSLALVAFAGAGYSPRGRHPFARVVKHASAWLRGVQGEDGFVGETGGASTDEGHALAAFALAELWRVSGDATGLREAVQGALAPLSAVLNRNAGDLRTVGWVLAAVATARSENRRRQARGEGGSLDLDPEVEAALVRALEAAPSVHGARGAALALVGRILLLGEDPRRSNAVQQLAAQVAANPPQGDALDPWYVFFATHGTWPVGGRPWKAWNGKLEPAVADTCIHEGSPCCERGSWNVLGPDAALGGRLAATALLALSLEIYYEYQGPLSGG